MRTLIPFLLVACRVVPGADPAPDPAESENTAVQPAVIKTARPAQQTFQVDVHDASLRFRFEARDVAGRLYRSTTPFGPADLSNPAKSISRPFAIRAGSEEYTDESLASGVDYYYAMARGDEWHTAGPVRIKARPLPTSQHPMLRVDKSLYTLSVVAKGRTLKRYAIALGGKPHRRKFEQDRASTPEGRYKLHGVQPKATFHRAYDVDYPRPVDFARHHLLGSTQPIGGEIQIHGWGLNTGNWTWGCIALRNEDMDELFRHPEIGMGTEVWIAGGELTWADLESDARTPLAGPAELGRFQKHRGLPVTCIADTVTRGLWAKKRTP